MHNMVIFLLFCLFSDNYAILNIFGSKTPKGNAPSKQVTTIRTDQYGKPLHTKKTERRYAQMSTKRKNCKKK